MDSIAGVSPVTGAALPDPPPVVPGSGGAFAHHVRQVREGSRAPGTIPPAPASTPTSVTDAVERARLARLREACVELEATLWSQVFRQMDSGFSAGNGKGPFEDDSATRSFREMLDTERGRQMARTGNGLAEALYQQLAGREHTTWVAHRPPRDRMEIER